MNERNKKAEAESGAGPRDDTDDPILRLERAAWARSHSRLNEARLDLVAFINKERQQAAAEVASLRAQLTQLEGGWDKETVKKQVADFNVLCDTIRELRAQLTEARRERDANHAHACELSLEERDLRKALTEAQQARDDARELLATAAMRINCAGPVHHRIDVLRGQLTEYGQKAEAKAEAAEATLASLRQLAVKWRNWAIDWQNPSAVDTIENCADELDAAIAGAGPTPPQEPT
jgi:chromosome segregation ATPase